MRVEVDTKLLALTDRVAALEARLDAVDAKSIREMRRNGMLWKDIHEWHYPHLSLYKVKKLGEGSSS